MQRNLSLVKILFEEVGFKAHMCTQTTPSTQSSPQTQPNLGELLDGVLRALVVPVDNVDSVGLGVLDVVLHEAAEAGQVGRDAGDAHHSALRCKTHKHMHISSGEHVQNKTPTPYCYMLQQNFTLKEFA